MKKKLFVVIIAIALVATIVGTAFAVFVKTDERHASIGYDSSSVTLVIKDSGSELANDFVLTAIEPEQTITKTITLTTNNNVALIQNGAEGEFVVTIAAATTGDTDKNAELLSHVTFSATDSDSNTYTRQQLADGVKISLLTIPEYFTLSISLPSEEAGNYDFMDVAEASLALHLEWNRVEFATVASAYYVIGTVRGSDATWDPSINSYKLGAGQAGHSDRAYGEFEFKAGDEFCVTTGNKSAWSNPKEDMGLLADNSHVTIDNENAVVVMHANGNVQIKADGTYAVYVNSDGELWVQKAN